MNDPYGNESPYQAPQADIHMSTSGHQAVGLTSEDKQAGMLCHLLAYAGFAVPLGNFFGPLIVWLMKKDGSSFADSCGRESLNFQISMLIWMAISGLLCLVLIGIPMLIAVIIMDLVFPLIAGLKANEGEVYRYPLTIRFL